MEYIVRCIGGPGRLPKRRPRKRRTFTTESATRMIQAAARGLLTRDHLALEEAWAAYIQVHVRAFLERRRQEDQRCFGLFGWWRRIRSGRPAESQMVTWDEPPPLPSVAPVSLSEAEYEEYEFVETAAFAPGSADPSSATTSLPPRRAQL